MERTNNHFGWVLAACAAVVAQAAPTTLCRSCDQPCCAVVHEACCHDEPCHCQLDARDEQPLSQGPLTACADGGPALGLAMVLPLVPQVLGVSREYLAVSLAMPIRPPRILFGVWRI